MCPAAACHSGSKAIGVELMHGMYRLHCVFAGQGVCRQYLKSHIKGPTKFERADACGYVHTGAAGM